MLDSYGRIPKGLAQENNVDFGMFDQCINIVEHLNTTSITGKYCYGGLTIPADKLNSNVQWKQIVRGIQLYY